MADLKPTQFLWADLFQRRKRKQDPVIEVLRENVLFEALTANELQYLSKRVYVRNYERGEAVFTEGERGFGMFSIARGKVAIKTQGAESDVLMTTLEKGSFFGEMTLIQPDAVRSASAIAVDPTVLVGFFKPDLMDIVARKPALGVKILFQLSRILSERLLATTERVTHDHPKSA